MNAISCSIRGLLIVALAILAAFVLPFGLSGCGEGKSVSSAFKSSEIAPFTRRTDMIYVVYSSPEDRNNHHEEFVQRIRAAGFTVKSVEFPENPYRQEIWVETTHEEYSVDYSGLGVTRLWTETNTGGGSERLLIIEDGKILYRNTFV